MFAKEVYVLPIIVLLRTTWAVRTEAEALGELDVQVHDPDQQCADATVQKLIEEYRNGEWHVDQATACAQDWVMGVKKGFCDVKLREYDACIRAAATAATRSYAEGSWVQSKGTVCEEKAEDVRNLLSDYLGVSKCATLNAYLKGCEREPTGDGCDRAKSRYSQWLEGVHADFCGVVVREDDSTCALALAAKLKQSYKRGEWRVTRDEVCVKKGEEEAGGMEKSYNRAMADVPQCVLYREFKSSAEVLQCIKGERTGDDCDRFKKRALALLLAVHTNFCEDED